MCPRQKRGGFGLRLSRKRPEDAPVGDFPELTFFREWLERGYAGDMAYLHRSAEKRADVRNVVPAAQSVIVTATNYHTDRPYSTESADPNRAEIARYAWGDDYHDVIGRRLDALVAWMREVADEPFDARAYVDTGPVQERVYAARAGIGWIGKNTCLIHPELGSIEDFRGLSLPRVTDWGHLDLNYKIVARIDAAKCIGCDLCYIACWDGAHQCIHIEGFRNPEELAAHSQQTIAQTPVASQVDSQTTPPLRIPRVDEHECVGCNLCWLVCPVESCITMEEVDTGKPAQSWTERTAGGSSREPQVNADERR